MTRAVAIDERTMGEIESLGLELLSAGDIRATAFLSLALAWQYAPEVPRVDGDTPSVNAQTFRCHVDESAGLAEQFSVKVPHAG